MRTRCPSAFLALALSLFLPATVLAANGPGITTQPQSQSVLTGSNAVFTVVAGGQLPLSYQWSFNGTNLANSSHIGGATSATLTVSNITVADGGNYKVLVSNSHGSVTSSNATLTVLSPPAITSQPVNQSVLLSNNVTFAASVSGTLPLICQWYFNGAPLADGNGITGSATTNLNLSNIQTAEAGSYQFIATNNYGSATSTVATLTVSIPATITLQPTNQASLIDGMVVFSVNATGTGLLTWQWRQNGTNLTDGGSITGSATSTLTISNVQMSNFGNYSVMVSNAYGTAVSKNANLMVVPVVTWSDYYNVDTNAPPGATNATAIAGGYDFSLALKSDGTILGWGTDSSGQIDPPVGLSNVEAITAGFNFGLALQNNGTVVGWGDNSSGQTNIPAGLSNVVAISAGWYYGLALKNDGTVIGWGDNYFGQTSVPAGLSNVVAIATGTASSLALKSDGTIVGWGFNQDGEINIPAGLSNVVAIAQGSYSGLALKSDGTLAAWGYGGGVNVPVGLSNVVAIGVGELFGLALKSDGTVIEWGSGATVPTGLSNVVSVAAGRLHGLALVQNPVVEAAPTIWWQGPTNNIVPTGKNLIFHPYITGSLPINWQWYFNGTPLIGRTNQCLVLSSIQPGQEGDYQFVASNNYGSVTSQVAVVSESPGILTQPVSESIGVSSNAQFSASATGPGSLYYQWYFNGTPLTDGAGISGSTTATLTLSGVQTNDAGSYQLIVTNNYGAAASTPAVLTVLTPPAVTVQPQNQTVVMNSNVTFTVSAIGPPSLNYQWYSNGAPLTNGPGISGSATTNLTLLNIQINQAGSYWAVISNPYGSTTSSNASLTVIPPVQILKQPANQTVVLGSNATFSATASGPGSLYYQWYFNGTPLTDGPEISGSATTNLNLLNVQTNQAGSYVLVATNQYNSATSAAATLTVLTPPVITVQPASQTVSVGGVATLSVEAIGTAPLAYQWQDNGTNLSDGGRISGSATATLTISNAQTSDLGNYQAFVSNPYGTNASSAAVLSVVPIIGWGDNTSSQINFPPTATNAVAITARFFASLAIKGDGTVTGWGDDDWGESSPPAGLSNVVAVAMAYHDGLALESNGTVIGWGDNSYNQTIPPAGLSNVVAIATYYEHTLALKSDGTVTGWGDNSYGQLNIPAGLSNVVAVAAGWEDSLALKSDGTVVGWGDNSAGESVPPTGLSNVVAISSGAFHSLALKSDGTVVPWGETTENQSALPAGLSNVVAIADSDYNCLALKQNGPVLGWGDNQYGESVAPTGLSNAVAIAAGRFHGLALMPNPLVQNPPAIWWQPSFSPLVNGQSLILNPYLIGSLPMQFQWYLNGAPLAGQTNKWLALSSAQANQSGTYELIASNPYGSVTSSIPPVTIIAPVQIIGQPSSQNALLGTNVTFSVTASGTGPFTYQWYFNGTPLSDGSHIGGSATASLNITNVQSTDAGGYRVVVSNLLTSATSLTASLTPQLALGPSTRYVMLTSTNPQSPYLDWSTAATNIQDAVDAAVAGDSVVVSNGIYNFGGRLVYGTNAPNRVVINKAITVQSLNGPAATTIVGFNTTGVAFFPGRCVYLTNGTFLSGFTLRNGAAGTASADDLVHEKSGGGIWCEGMGAVISNCVFFANSASSGYGGGAFGGTLFNCLLTTNSGGGGGGAASNILINCSLVKNSSGTQIIPYGGGAYGSTLSNCVLSANSSTDGGGAYGSVLFNCILTNNSSSEGAGAFSSVLYNCILAYNVSRSFGGGGYSSTLYNCTVVTNTSEGANGGGIWGGAATNCVIYYNFPGGDVENSKNVAYCCASGITTLPGCITNPPLLVNLANGDFHLQSNSPCINSGENVAVTVSTDFAGNPRIVGGTVDMGAYEYQTPASIISYAWLEQYSLPTDGSVDFSNLDGTAFSVYQDYIAGLNPTNSASVLQAHLGVPSTGITITWASLSTRNYYVQRSTNLVTQPFITIQNFIAGHTGTASYTDTTATNSGPYFYRVGVLLP